MAQELVKCPVCLLPPRIGDPMDPLRIEDGDAEGLAGALYLICRDCMRNLAPKKALRLGKKVEEMACGDYF